MTYAIMQIVLSTFMAKINLRIYLTVTVAISAILTLLLGIAPSIEFVYFVCAFNGIVQAGIYSGCMSVLSKYLPFEMLNFANKIMNFASSAYGILSYGVTALFVQYGLWNVPFFVLGIPFLISAFFLFYCINKVKENECYKLSNIKTIEVKQTKDLEFIKLSGKTQKIKYFIVMFFITLLANTMVYMVINWVPNLLYDVFGLSQSYSILMTLGVSILSALCAIWAIDICSKKENLISISLIFFFVSALIGVLLIFFYDFNIVLSIIMILGSLAFGAGGRTVFAGVLAFRMRKQIDTGAYLSSTNAVASVCAGVMPVIAGAIIESYSGHVGYSVVFLIFSIVGIILLITLGVFFVWHRKHKKKQYKYKNEI